MRVRLLMAKALWLLAATSGAAAPVNYSTVRIGNPGNPSDSTGYGSVPYEYALGTYMVTIGQYAGFLNAVARTDPYGLYSPSMATDTYSVIGPFGASNGQSASNRPITYVSWFDAARFANWMSNGQPTGPQNDSTTETGAYSLNGAVTGNAKARNAVNPNTGLEPSFRLPTENEWYKAAYYSPEVLQFGGYYTYGTQSFSVPSNSLGEGWPNAANYKVPVFVGGWYGTQYSYSVTQSWGYNESQNYLTDVGAFPNTKTYYGTYDQAGNAEQWNDLAGNGGRDVGFRGGSFLSIYPSQLSKSSRPLPFPEFEYAYVGFRLAAPVPEPSTHAMALVGLGVIGYAIRRRRQRRLMLSR
jgi:formylglycine-generating enzyme required for sulfatase activity